MENKCEAYTRKGNSCKRNRIKNSKYCYIHSFGKFDNITFWKNPTVHSIIIIILTLISLFFVIRNHYEILKETAPQSYFSIVELADRALWEQTKECGDYHAYENLLIFLSHKKKNEHQKIIYQIERIKNDYRDSILVPRLSGIRAVCQRGTMKGDGCEVEPVEGFSAENVIEHLDIKKYPRCTSRARAACILRNINTASGKETIDMMKVVETLVFIIGEDPSLLVRKLALDRYSQFTGFPSSDVFDFESAIKDYNNKKKLNKPILLPKYCFKNE